VTDFVYVVTIDHYDRIGRNLKLLLLLLLLLPPLLWRCCPTSASSIPSLQASLSPAAPLRLLHFDVPFAPLSNSSNYFSCGHSIRSSHFYVSFQCFLGHPFLLITWPTQWSILNLIFLFKSIFLYNLLISWCILFGHCSLSNIGP